MNEIFLLFRGKDYYINSIQVPDGYKIDEVNYNFGVIKVSQLIVFIMCYRLQKIFHCFVFEHFFFFAWKKIPDHDVVVTWSFIFNNIILKFFWDN